MPDTPEHSFNMASIVVDQDERVLVIRRADNAHREMPVGVLELDESFEDGVSREVAEETGMNVTVGELCLQKPRTRHRPRLPLHPRHLARPPHRRGHRSPLDDPRRSRHQT